MGETRYYLGLKFSHTKREWKSRYLPQEEVYDLAAIASSMPETKDKEEPIGLPKPTEITIHAENNREIISIPFRR